MQIMQPICTSPRTKSRQLLRSLSTEHIASAKKDHNVSLETVKMGSTSTPKSQSGRSSKRDSSSRRSKDNFVDDPENDPKNDYYTLDELVDQKIYITRQETAPFAKLFSWVQFMILVIMMIQCKVAPLNINPMIGPYPDALDYWGGKNAYKILNEGEYYRLLTPILLHAGVLHLVGNVAVQLDQGAFYEKEWGSVVWLIIYISSAIGSSILSCCFMPDNVSVGSSGAVMGLFGAKLAEVFCRACESDKSQQGKVGHFGTQYIMCFNILFHLYLSNYLGVVVIIIMLLFCTSSKGTIYRIHVCRDTCHALQLCTICRLGSPFRRSSCWLLRRYGLFFMLYQK